MIIDFDVQINWPWFQHQDLRHTNAEKGANLDFWYLITIMKRLFLTGKKYT